MANDKKETKNGKKNQYEIKIKPHLDDIKRYVRCGVTEEQIFEYYGVGRTAWYSYKKNHAELNEILCNSKEEMKFDLINKAYEVAIGGYITEEKTVTERNEKGEVISTKTTEYKRYMRPDAGMIQFLLINRYSNEFARDPQAIELRKRALEIAEKNGGILPQDAEGI